MELIYVIGQKSSIRETAQMLVEYGCLHVLNAVKQVNKHMALTSEYVYSYSEIEEEFTYNDAFSNKIDELTDVLDIRKSVINKRISINDLPTNLEEEINRLYNEISGIKHIIGHCEKDLNDIRDLQRKLKDIKTLSYSLDDLNNMHYFNFKIGRVRKESYLKLKENFENIPSIIYRVNTLKDYIVLAAFTPIFTLQETETILGSLGFVEISLPKNVSGVPGEVLKSTENSVGILVNKIEELKEKLERLRQEQSTFIKQCYDLLKIHKQQNQIIRNAAFTNEHFYISGWVPERCIEKINEGMNEIGNTLIVLDRTIFETGDPPTLLKNNPLVKPFEFFVRMYGLPLYNEIDPTFFVAVSYMLMFGMMFGDLGHGFVLLLGGLMINRLKGKSDFGGILIRIGTGSMLFGVLYGSVFGNETLIKPIWIRPLDNINTILIAGIVLGIVLATVAYIFNLINMRKTKNIEEGIFGSEGLAGFLLFILLLATALGIIFQGKTFISSTLTVVMLIVLMIMIVLRQPLAKLLQGQRAVPSGKISDYYVESVFGLIETLLGLFSKTVSFVRLGAFALNHGGLFLAFEALSKMTGTKGAGIVVIILGNIIVIGLEGLVVFIQGLRLEYFELFGRFFKGGGKMYEPVNLVEDKKNGI